MVVRDAAWNFSTHRCDPFTWTWEARGASLGALADNADDELKTRRAEDVTIYDSIAPWRRIGGTIEVPSPRDGGVTTLAARTTARSSTTEPVVDLALGMKHWTFAATVGASGLAGRSFGMAPGAGRDLGAARSIVRYATAWRTCLVSREHSKIDFRPASSDAAGTSRACAAMTLQDPKTAPDASDHERLAHVPRLQRPQRRRSALFVRTLLLPTERQAFTGIAASTCANYPPRCHQNGSARRPRAARRQSPASGQEPVPVARPKKLGRQAA